MAGDSSEDKGRFVVMVRHAIAEDRVEGKPDADRTLTREGQQRFKEVSKGLRDLFPKADALYASPYVRCVQTALFISRAYGGKLKVETSPLLQPEAKPDDMLQLLNGIAARRIIVVSHEPTLTRAMTSICGIKSSSLELKKGGCYGIRLHDDRSGELEWLVPPRVFRRL